VAVRRVALDATEAPQRAAEVPVAAGAPRQAAAALGEAVERQPAAAALGEAVERQPAAAALAGAAVRQPAAARDGAAAVRRPEAVAVAWGAAAVRRPEAEAPDVRERRRVALPLAVPWASRRGQPLPWPAPRPVARFAHAMATQRDASP
jgi:hypothetical protein